ncbi:MAG: DUF3883 domain-containing protein, partial [Paludibacteraceae bacterium]|nr:DUF3883 domain-containing protein [Paludibacteraceae bacterium]
AGLNAEKLVYQSLLNDENFTNVVGISRNLDPIHGDDNKHYDIKYRRKDTPEIEHYLEVKSMKYDTIMLSRLEYNFALEHSDSYDLAIVHDGQVTIIEKPFYAEENRTPLAVTPDNYIVSMELNVVS